MTPTDPTELQQAVTRVRLCRSQGPDVAYPDAQPGAYIRDCDEIVEAFLSLLDAGELVRVRGLEWKEDGVIRLRADSLVGPYYVKLNGWTSWDADDWYAADSLDDGRRLAEAHYRSRLAAALEPLLPEVRT